jgi:hypothetical protein
MGLRLYVIEDKDFLMPSGYNKEEIRSSQWTAGEAKLLQLVDL